MIYLYHHQSLDWERVEAYLDHLRPVVVPEKASIAQEVLEVAWVPACILPIKDGQTEFVLGVWKIWATCSFDHNVFFLYIPVCESWGMARERCRKKFLEPFNSRHVLIIFQHVYDGVSLPSQGTTPFQLRRDR
jgi:hypothetical protein